MREFLKRKGVRNVCRNLVVPDAADHRHSAGAAHKGSLPLAVRRLCAGCAAGGRVSPLGRV